MTTGTHALTIKPSVHTHIHLLMCAHHTTQVNTHTYSYTHSHSDTHTCTQILTHICTHMHWHKHMHAVTHFHTPICSHSFAHSHMHSHSHVNSQCLCIQSHACTCSDFTLYTKELTDSACIYSHIHSHTFMHIHSHTHTYSQLLSHMLIHTCTHSHTCTHIIQLHKPNLHPSAACLSRPAQAWPHLMAASRSLFSFLVLFIFLSHNEHIWRRIYFHCIWKHTSPRP